MRVRLMAAAAVLVVVAGCGLGGRGDDKAEGSAPVAVTAPSSPSSPSEEPTPEDSPTPEETTSSPTPKPSKTKVSKTPTIPPEDVNNFEVSPCHTTEGTEVSKTKVKAALKTAAGKIYWTHEAPTLKLNYPLVKAIAWHESGWQSNVFNCDGGQGLMQLMPETVDMINNRFGLSYNVSKYQENATAGANYLAWLTRYMSQKQFGEKTYDLSASKCKTHSSWCLLNLVISAYQAGPDAVLQNAKTKKLPNPAYVDSVRSLMSSCFCDRY